MYIGTASSSPRKQKRRRKHLKKGKGAFYKIAFNLYINFSQTAVDTMVSSTTSLVGTILDDVLTELREGLPDETLTALEGKVKEGLIRWCGNNSVRYDGKINQIPVKNIFPKDVAAGLEVGKLVRGENVAGSVGGPSQRP